MLTIFCSTRYDSVLPVHHLWLGYMAELLALPILLPSAAPTPDPIARPTEISSVLLPTFPPRPSPATQPPPGADLKLNVPVVQTKLLKAEFVGCKLTGASHRTGELGSPH